MSSALLHRPLTIEALKPLMEMRSKLVLDVRVQFGQRRLSCRRVLIVWRQKWRKSSIKAPKWKLSGSVCMRKLSVLELLKVSIAWSFFILNSQTFVCLYESSMKLILWAFSGKLTLLSKSYNSSTLPTQSQFTQKASLFALLTLPHLEFKANWWARQTLAENSHCMHIFLSLHSLQVQNFYEKLVKAQKLELTSRHDTMCSAHGTTRGFCFLTRSDDQTEMWKY